MADTAVAIEVVKAVEEAPKMGIPLDQTTTTTTTLTPKTRTTNALPEPTRPVNSFATNVASRDTSKLNVLGMSKLREFTTKERPLKTSPTLRMSREKNEALLRPRKN